MKNVVFFPNVRAESIAAITAARFEEHLAVIIPTLNERDAIEPLIRALDKALAGISHELVFVDDWSLDGTYQLLLSIARARADIRVLGRQGRRGLSSAVIEGVMATSADFVAVIDPHMLHDEAILREMVDALIDNRTDIAIGSLHGDDGSAGDRSAGLGMTSGIAARIAQMLLRLPVEDPMSGFFMVRRETIVNLIPELSRRGRNILLDLMLSARAPLRVTETRYRVRPHAAEAGQRNDLALPLLLLLLLKKTFRKYIPARFVTFGMVGLLGLGVHLAVLRSLLLINHFGFAISQASAVTAAIGFNFLMNNMITYRDRRLKGWRLITGAASFYIVCGLGAIANVGVGSLVFSGHHLWWVAGFAGAVVGSVWNFAMSSTLTWRRK